MLAVLAGLSALVAALAAPSTALGARGEHRRADAATASGPSEVAADPFTASAPGLAPGQIEITTASTRPALVSGGEARSEVRGLDPTDKLTVTRNGADVSAVFVPVPGRLGVEQGVVTGLKVGRNELVATADGKRFGRRTARLEVIDHSLQGPVISGPHQRPFVCETETSGLGPPLDADCVAPTQIRWYRSDLLGNFTPLANPYAPYPAGTATTKVANRTVPVVVRVESIVINRGIARIAVLDDPAARGPRGAFRADEWNHRLLWHFGESCGTGYHQGSSHEDEVFGQLTSLSASNLAGPVMDLAGLLRNGWMVGQSTLTTFGVHCNQILSAETLMMTKEHIIDEYGTITHTIGAGASGGAIQQYTIGDQYPGLLDGGTPLLSFPDVLTTAMTVHDCVLLERVFAADPKRWTLLKQIAVTGLATPQVCKDWTDLFGPNLRPDNCPAGIPHSQIYDPRSNPHGVRCDLQDDLVNVVGRDPATGFAYRPVDNQGVQYGLVALEHGLITPADFIELNRDIGGFDIDARHRAARTSMPDSIAARAYRYGFVSGRGAIDQMPVIDQAIPASDVLPIVDIHDQIRPYEMQARLDKTFGSHGTQSIWNGVPVPANAIVVVEQWLDRLDRLLASEPGMARADAIARSRPPGAGSQCRLVVIGVPLLCDRGLLRHSSPRQQAGGPFTEDNIKCQRVPVSAATEPRALDAAQIVELRRVFPDGVCDWSEPPVGYTPSSLTWLQFTAPGQAVTVPYTLARSAVPRAR